MGIDNRILYNNYLFLIKMTESSKVYNANCKYQDCAEKCCNINGVCPEQFNKQFSYSNPQTKCHYFYAEEPDIIKPAIAVPMSLIIFLLFILNIVMYCKIKKRQAQIASSSQNLAPDQGQTRVPMQQSQQNLTNSMQQIIQQHEINYEKQKEQHGEQRKQEIIDKIQKQEQIKIEIVKKQKLRRNRNYGAARINHEQKIFSKIDFKHSNLFSRAGTTKYKQQSIQRKPEKTQQDHC